MKQRVIIVLCFLVLGLFLWKEYYPKSNVKENIFYFLEENSKDSFLFVGITKDLDVAERLINIYEEDDIKLDLKEVYLSNEELIINIEQFDLLSRKATSKEELLKIQEVVCANYEEVLKRGE